MYFHYVINIITVVLATYSAVHALINKKDSRAAFGWIAVCILFPIFGPVLYFIFGINRVQARALKLTNSLSNIRPDQPNAPVISPCDSGIPRSLGNLLKVSSRITGLPLTGGNDIEILYSGEQAYPRMLDAISAAKEYVYLCLYIFKADKIGHQFIEALVEAKNRGVEVCVLIDGIGEFYSWNKARSNLEKHSIEVRRFLPPKLMPFNFNINLRNHRKLLVIDDKISFIGGMNIADEYFRADENNKRSLKDIHFKMFGKITLQLKNVFESDWHFTGDVMPEFNYKTAIDDSNNPVICSSIVDEIAVNPDVFVGNSTATDDSIICRTIIDGPAENFDHLSILLLSAINSAVDNVTLMTPYFLPTREIIGALKIAALRGVGVSIILPEKNNLRYVNWASRHMLWELLERSVNIYYQPEPFAHSKIFVVDHQYSLIGSANIDPRSLRLNYEVGVEVYDAEFANKLNEYVQNILQTCRQLTLEEVDNRALSTKIRDGVAWLFSPYL